MDPYHGYYPKSPVPVENLYGDEPKWEDLGFFSISTKK